MDNFVDYMGLESNFDEELDNSFGRISPCKTVGVPLKSSEIFCDSGEQTTASSEKSID